MNGSDFIEIEAFGDVELKFGIEVAHIGGGALRRGDKQAILLGDPGEVLEVFGFELAETERPGTNFGPFGLIGDEGIGVNDLRDDPGLKEDRLGGQIGIAVNDCPAEFLGVEIGNRNGGVKTFVDRVKDIAGNVTRNCHVEVRPVG